MLVKLIEDVNNPIDFEIESTSIREILNHIKNVISEDISDSILYEKHLFLGRVGDDFKPLEVTRLVDELPLYPELIIIRTHDGEEPISATMIMAASISATSALGIGAAGGTILMSATVAAGIATVLNTAIMIGISMAVSAIMSPDSSFTADPSKAQNNSKLFNQSVITREQGGSVPLCYGNPFCAGVLISSGITSVERAETTTSIIQTPDNQTPIDGIVGQPTTITLTASAFAMDPGETGTHISSDWVVSTNASFTDQVKSSSKDTAHKTSITFSGLKSATTYYWKVRYRIADGTTSAWSTFTSFTTA